MNDYYSNQNDNKNDYYSDQNNYYSNPGNYSSNRSDSMFQDGGFESGSPIVRKMNDFKSLMAEEIIAKSFIFMVFALIITAVASLTVSPGVAVYLLSGYNFFILLLAELAIVSVSNWALSHNNVILGGVLFAVYSYITGVTFSVLFMVYTTASITTIFGTTAVIFAVMAIYGLITKRDLSSVGNILFMGLLGIIIVGFVNLFLLRSSMLDTVICGIGVIIFVGLTAYDTQKIKSMVSYANDDNVLSLAMFGAFELYLDFINLFLKLLRLFGKRK